MFANCHSLIGGNGTTYASLSAAERDGGKYAVIDKAGQKGLLTYRATPGNPVAPVAPNQPASPVITARLSGSSFTYTGAPITPSLNVQANDVPLVEGRDYTVSFANNVNAGTASATVTGIGLYAGTSKTVSFNISPASLSSAVVTASGVTYTGKALYPMPSVKIGSANLRIGQDFIVSYMNNKNAGAATVTVTGIGNYSGAKSATFKIAKATQPMTVKAVTKTLKAASFKKKAVAYKGLITVKKAQGKVTYKNLSTTKSLKAFKVDSKTGSITVPKAVKKGTYKIKVKVSAAGKGSYASGYKTVTVVLKIK